MKLMISHMTVRLLSPSFGHRDGCVQIASANDLHCVNIVNSISIYQLYWWIGCCPLGVKKDCQERGFA